MKKRKKFIGKESERARKRGHERGEKVVSPRLIPKERDKVRERERIDESKIKRMIK